MLDLDEIRERLKMYNLAKVARHLGISYMTMHSLANGNVKNPGYRSVKAISDYLESERA